MTAPIEHLFVYGTLRRDAHEGRHDLLAQTGRFVGYGTLAGRLYRVGHYAGLVDARPGDGCVHGEIHMLTKPASVLAELDAYEEYGPGFAEPWEFVRDVRTICCEDGSDVAAWTYLYNRPVDGLVRIASGDYLDIGE